MGLSTRSEINTIKLVSLFFIIIAFSIAAVESHTGHMAFML